MIAAESLSMPQIPNNMEKRFGIKFVALLNH